MLLRLSQSLILSSQNRTINSPAVVSTNGHSTRRMTANGMSFLALASAVATERHSSPRTVSYAHFLDYAGRELERTRKCLGARFDLLCVEPDCYLAAATANGRDAAERLCGAAADHLATLLWPRDTMTIIGGGRIAILFDTQSIARSTADFVDELQRQLMSGFMHDDREIRTTASIGIARLTPGYQGVAAVLDDGAAALARARREGRARSARFSPFVDRRLAEANEFGADVSAALEKNELEIYYQPIVSTETGKLDAFETLLRWRHPSDGLQRPEEFLLSLENSGLMVETGEWMIRTIASQSARWTETTGQTIPLTINLSGEQLRSESLIESLVSSAVASDQISLLVEVKEEEILGDAESLIPVLERLRANGVRVVLEGIGTAMCCLEYLADLPIDAIKLDATFADRVTRYSSHGEMVSQVVELAHRLELDVIGMRIERSDQMYDVMAVCDEMQGFLISQPVDVEAATVMIDGDWSIEMKPFELMGTLS